MLRARRQPKWLPGETEFAPGIARWCGKLQVPVSPTEYQKEERTKMRKMSLAGVLVAFLLLAGAAAASAQEVTQAEKDRALQYLETTKKGVLDATRGLSEAQWNFKPA